MYKKPPDSPRQIGGATFFTPMTIAMLSMLVAAIVLVFAMLTVLFVDAISEGHYWSVQENEEMGRPAGN